MAKDYLTISDWSRGETNNPAAGRENQFFKGANHDYWSFPGRLTLLPGSTAVSYDGDADWGSPIRAITNSRSEDTVFCALQNASSAGLIVKGESTTSLDFSLNSGNRPIISIDEYRGKTIAVYDDGQTIVTDHASPQPGTNGSDWGLGADIWQSGDQVIFNGILQHGHQISAIDRHYFTAGEYVASVNGDPADVANYDRLAFNLGAGWIARSLAPYGNQYLAIAANFKGNDPDATTNKISIWNGVATTSDKQLVVPEAEIHAIYSLNGYLWIWAGQSCNLYVNPIGSDIVYLVKRFFNASTELSRVKFTVYPHAVAHKENRIYFGLSNVDEESAEYNPNGIYSFNADPNDFNIGMAYPAQGAESQMYALEVVQATGNNILFWSEETAGGASNVFRQKLITSDQQAFSNAVTQPETYSIWYEAPAGSKIRVSSIAAHAETLPAGCTVAVTVENENLSTISMTTMTVSDSYTITHKVLEGRKIRVRYRIGNANGDKYPMLDRIVLGYELIPDNL